MRTQKIIKLSLFIIAICSITIASAQPGPRGPRGPRGNMLDSDKLKTELNLTDAQVQQIESLTEEQRTQMQALREQDFESREARREAMKEIHTAYKNGLAEILNDEQEAQLKVIQQEARAKRKARAEEFGQKRKEARQDIGTYRTEHIKPVILEQRTKLETKISAEDKALLAELRAEKPERPKRLENPSMEERKAAKAAFEAGKAEREAFKAKLQALVETYASDIDELYAEIRPQVEEWKKEIGEIAQEHHPSEMKKRKDGESSGAGKKAKDRKHRKRGQKGERSKSILLPKGAFLLLDPNAPISDAEVMPQSLTEIKVFPNPTFNQNTLSYEVKEPGHLRIELHNDNGRLLEVLFDGTREAGAYQLDVDMSKLRNGVYYYTVQDQNGVQSHKVIVNK